MLWEWANENRHTAINRTPIPRDIHEEWFKRKLKDPNCIIWLLDNAFESLGQIRYDVEDAQAFIDISVVPRFQHYGLGKFIIRQSAGMLLEKHPQVKALVAQIRSDNSVSRKFFASLGFRQTKAGGVEEWKIGITQ